MENTNNIYLKNGVNYANKYFEKSKACILILKRY